MLGSTFFQGYQRTLSRVLFVEMLDEHQELQRRRRLSIVGPCFTHDQWLAMQAERRAAVASQVAVSAAA
jgi:hypothetical protein